MYEVFPDNAFQVRMMRVLYDETILVFSNVFKAFIIICLDIDILSNKIWTLCDVSLFLTGH